MAERQRQSLRAELQVPLLVQWQAGDKRLGQEAVKTRVVNAHGCLVLLKASLAEGQRVTLTNRESNQTQPGRVVWNGGVEQGRLHRTGIELATPDPKFWGQPYVDFVLRTASTWE